MGTSDELHGPLGRSLLHQGGGSAGDTQDGATQAEASPSWRVWPSPGTSAGAVGQSLRVRPAALSARWPQRVTRLTRVRDGSGQLEPVPFRTQLRNPGAPQALVMSKSQDFGPRRKEFTPPHGGMQAPGVWGGRHSGTEPSKGRNCKCFPSVCFSRWHEAEKNHVWCSGSGSSQGGTGWRASPGLTQRHPHAGRGSGTLA